MKIINRRSWTALISLLASMKTAINLLIIVAIISALGTFIPQGQTPDFYISQYGPGIGKVILFLSLHSLYHSGWYQTLMAFLCLTVLICCYRRLRHARSLKKAASLCFHLAIVIILAGAAWSLGYARSASVEINEGENIDLASYGFAQGVLSLQDFNIDYYPDFQPRQYRSKLHLIDYNGREYTKEISVNHPLQAGNLKIYQSSWGWNLKIRNNSGKNSKSFTMKNRDAYLLNKADEMYLKAIFITDYDPTTGMDSKTPLPNNPNLVLALVQNDEVKDMAMIKAGSTAQLGQYQFSFKGYSYYSGLEIKSDPGVNMVFAGFILLLIGLIARYWQLFFARKGD